MVMFVQPTDSGKEQGSLSREVRSGFVLLWTFVNEVLTQTPSFQ